MRFLSIRTISKRLKEDYFELLVLLYIKYRFNS